MVVVMEVIQPSSVCRTNATHEHSHGRPDQSHTFGPRRWPAQIEPHSEEIKPSPTKVRLDRISNGIYLNRGPCTARAARERRTSSVFSAILTINQDQIRQS